MISIVIPVHNEAPNLEPLRAELEAVLDALGEPWELVIVDDGSTDESPAILRAWHAANERITVVRFLRSYGQTAALKSGFDHARGEIVVTLDGDLQNDPADIPRLLQNLDAQTDVVCGWRRKRQDPFIRVLPSRIANALIRLISGVRIHDAGCTLRAYRASVIHDLELYGEMHRLIPVLTHSRGARVREIEVNHRARTAGESKYIGKFSLGFGLRRPLNVILDLVAIKFFYTFFSRPLHIFGLLGVLMVGAATIALAAVALMKLFGEIDMTGNPLLYLGMLLMLMGGQFFGLGLLGEISMRTYYESQAKPIYVVEEVLERDH